MKPITTAPDRRALEAAFLILSLLPRRAKAVDSIKEAARRVAGVKMRGLRRASYEQWADSDGQRKAGNGFWRAYASLEAPGARANAVGLVVPEYPLVESQDVNRCDLKCVSEAVWYGMGRMQEEVNSRAPA